MTKNSTRPLINGGWLTYSVAEETYYASTLTEWERASIDVSSSFYDEDGRYNGSGWSFSIFEHQLGDWALKIEMYDDALAALVEIGDFFELVRDKASRIEDVRAILDGMGAGDTTKRERP